MSFSEKQQDHKHSRDDDRAPTTRDTHCNRRRPFYIQDQGDHRKHTSSQHHSRDITWHSRHNNDTPHFDKNCKRHHSPEVSHSQPKRSRYDKSHRIDRYSGHYSSYSSGPSSVINSETPAQATNLHSRSRSWRKPSRELERSSNSTTRDDNESFRPKYISSGRNSSTRDGNESFRPKYISSGRNRAQVSDTRQPYPRMSTYSRFKGQSSNRIPTASSKLPTDEIVPTHSGAVPYAGIASNVTDRDSLCDLIISGLSPSYPSTGKYYKEGEQGVQTPTEDLKQLHVAFKATLLNVARRCSSRFSLLDSEVQPINEICLLSSDYDGNKRVCDSNKRSTAEQPERDEENKKKEMPIVFPGSSNVTIMQPNIIADSDRGKYANAPVIVRRHQTKHGKLSTKCEMKEMEDHLQQIQHTESLYTPLIGSDVSGKMGTDDLDLDPSFCTDTPSPSGGVLMSGEDLTTSVSASNIMNITTNGDNMCKDDSNQMCSLNYSAIGGTNLKENLTRDSATVTLSSIPKVDPDIPCNEINEFTCRSQRTQYCYGQLQSLSQPSKWHCYYLNISPSTNFQCGLSTITVDSGQLFTFQGFSLVTRYPLQEGLPTCMFERYGGVYSIGLKPLPSLNIFTEEDVILFEEYLFVRLLEVYDWLEALKPFSKELMFLPLFISSNEGSQQVLPMAEVLKFLLDAHQPIYDWKCNKGKLGSMSEGCLVYHHSRRPSCLRVDGVMRPATDSKCVEFGHYYSSLTRPRNHAFNSSSKKKYSELMSKKSKGKLSRTEHFLLREHKHIFSSSSSEKRMPIKILKAEDLMWISCDGFFTTGIFYDIVQHTFLLSMISHHLLIYDSLLLLQHRLNCSLTDISLFHRAITHPSCTTLSYQLAEDHFKIVLLNCGVPNPEYITNTDVNVHRSNKGLKSLIESVENGDSGTQMWLQNNEQLEFLGDAVLEYLCSIHLYQMYPQCNVGKLNCERQTLVKNKTLGQLFSQVGISNLILTKKKVELSEESLRHAGANCLEALLGAILIDQGLDAVDLVFAKLAFTEEDKYTSWMRKTLHPLIQEYPDGDRHLIPESDILKKMVELEEITGVQFKHIRLLALAFTHSSCSSTDLIKGNYQRLEFLGDGILQYLVSKYLYMRFPSHHEGHLTMLRTSLVHNKQLSSLCQELGFNRYIQTSKTENIQLTVKLEADVVESYLAALSIDQGIDAAEKFLQQHVFPRLQTTIRSSQLMDANTRMHQAAAYTCKQQGVSLELPVYKVLPVEGTSSKPVFTVTVHFENKKIGMGTASTIREARRLAAEDSLKSSFLRIPPSQTALLKESK